MAKSDAVWGIDVGQCALKALRCRLHNDGKRLVADAYDFVEYPKILSQPDADPAALIADAIEQFLSRNNVQGDKVAISVSGQSGLARFIKLPPVESKKIPDIVKFEARQQIPFALEDVVWDFQQMAGGSEEDGYALETEVGLFAMKRDQVFRALKPFTVAGIEVDVVQLTPISLYNYIVFDKMQNLPPPDQFDPEDPPESQIVMSLGTDTTDLVITNGYRVWQRSIPLGGNHFTKAITKEMKVTFTKAEHLKRNALKTDEAKAIFQAMRPVFNDLVTEVQRSISFFNSLNKTAKLGKIIALGNTMKLRGLQKFLTQNLGIEVIELDQYKHLAGPTVVASPAFKDNVLAFGVCYGLCVQGVGRGVLSTNLLPDEILKDRLIREKKPWVLAAVAALMIGCGVGFAGYWRAWSSAQEAPYSSVASRISSVANEHKGHVAALESSKEAYNKVTQTGNNLANIAERRVLWLEMLKAVNECLPRDPKEAIPTELGKRNELHITRVDCELYPKLEDWFTDIKKEWQQGQGRVAVPIAAAPVPPNDGAAVDGNPADGAATDPAAPVVVGPTGEGWVIQLNGYHYHNEQGQSPRIHAQFIRDTLLKNVENTTIALPDGRFKLKEMGIEYPVLTYISPIRPETIVDPLAGAGKEAGAGAINTKPTTLNRCDFTVQFCWKETPASVRAANRKQSQEQSKPAPALAKGKSAAPESVQ